MIADVDPPIVLSPPIAEAARHFAQAGYAVFPRVLAEHIALLRGACDAFVAREDARMDAAGVDRIGISLRGQRYFANECQRADPALRQVLFGPVFAQICRALLGEEAYFFFDQFVVKGPEGGAPFSWHQDSGYVKSASGPIAHAPYLTCWCPLDDATEENGTVRLIPGSHLGGLRDHGWRPESNDLAVTVEQEGIAVPVPAGSVVAFSSLLLHATGANRGAHARRVYLAQFSPAPMLDPETGHLRRNAIRLLQAGRHVTLP